MIGAGFSELGKVWAKIPVVRSEVLAPRRDCVNLVHHDEAKVAPIENRVQRGLEQQLGRQIDYRGTAVSDALISIQTFFVGNVGVDGNHIFDATILKIDHLVVHQCFEGLDDERYGL